LKYSIDTSALMDAWIRYYPPDIMPDLWDKFGEMIDDCNMIATEEVFVEIDKQEDDLSEWVKQNKKMFLPIDEDVQLAVKNILNRFPKLINVKRSKSMADPFVIALALVKNAKVVTGEKAQHSADISLSKTNKVKIPDVCRVLGIQCLDIVGLCRDRGWIFHIR